MHNEEVSLEDVVLVLLNENLGNTYENINFGKFQKLLYEHKDESPFLKDILFDTNGGQPHSREIDEALGTLRTCGLLEVRATEGYRLSGIEDYINATISNFDRKDFDVLIKIGKEIKSEMKKYN